VQASFVLTVAESKRLIAQGVVRHPVVRRALSKGLVAVVKGTTNADVAEELAGAPMDKWLYARGRTLPATCRPERRAPVTEVPDLILRDGAPIALSLEEAAAAMGPGDVYIKGANALDYRSRTAAVLVGARDMGTIGLYRRSAWTARAHLVIPVGLEKQVSSDLHEASAWAAAEPEADGGGVMLYPIRGIIITEIEALALLAGVEGIQIGAGGVLGAEGSVRLLVRGGADQVRNALAVVAGVQGEPPYPLEPEGSGQA
jgi:hypothetical protein